MREARDSLDGQDFARYAPVRRMEEWRNRAGRARVARLNLFFLMESAAGRRYAAPTMKSIPLLAMLLALAGCSAPAPHPPETVPAAGSLPDKRVTVDPALRGVIRIKNVRDMPATQGYIKFQVDIENLASAAKTIVYQVDWLDGDGLSLGISMDEPPCTLFPHETVPLAISAPVPTAKDFHLTFRPRVK